MKRDGKGRVGRGGRGGEGEDWEWIEEHLFIQNRWNLSQWKFYRVASETVIEWKFCSKGIKFLSIWNTSERSSRVEQYRFRNVERNRIAWVCALCFVLFFLPPPPPPLLFFFCFSLFSYLSPEDRAIELNRCWERNEMYTVRVKKFIVTKNNVRVYYEIEFVGQRRYIRKYCESYAFL